MCGTMPLTLNSLIDILRQSRESGNRPLSIPVPLKVEQEYHKRKSMSSPFSGWICKGGVSFPALLSCGNGYPLHLAPAFEGSAESAFIGVFQGGADGQATRQASNLHVERF